MLRRLPALLGSLIVRIAAWFLRNAAALFLLEARRELIIPCEVASMRLTIRPTIIAKITILMDETGLVTQLSQLPKIIAILDDWLISNRYSLISRHLSGGSNCVIFVVDNLA